MTDLTQNIGQIFTPRKDDDKATPVKPQSDTSPAEAALSDEQRAPATARIAAQQPPRQTRAAPLPGPAHAHAARAGAHAEVACVPIALRSAARHRGKAPARLGARRHRHVWRALREERDVRRAVRGDQRDGRAAGLGVGAREAVVQGLALLLVDYGRRR
eukprot:569411-Prymnesium_polylepis.1